MLLDDREVVDHVRRGRSGHHAIHRCGFYQPNRTTAAPEGLSQPGRWDHGDRGCQSNDVLARCEAPGLLLMSGLCGEELLDENCGVVRILFREEVATRHRLPLRVRSPLPPNAQWTAFFCIESVERATLGP